MHNFLKLLCIFCFSRTQKKTPRPAFLQSAVPAFRSVSGQFISSRAFFRFCAIWSGQLVLRNPHSVPSRRAMTSSAFMPGSSLAMPFRLPSQPPRTCTLLMVWSSFSSTTVRTEQVPLLL